MAHEKAMGSMPPPAAATEGGRRPTDVAAAGGAPAFTQEGLPARNGNPTPPNPEVVDKPQRRRFTRAYKLDILMQIDGCSGVGQIGALLRREGLYSSHLTNWRLQRRQGLLDNAAIKKRGVKPTNHNARARLSQLQRENLRLKERLRQAELVLDIQKKASEMLGIPLKAVGNGGND